MILEHIRCFDIVDSDLRQCGATDRPSHALAVRRRGYGLVKFDADLVVNEATGEITVANVRAEWLPGAKEKA